MAVQVNKVFLQIISRLTPEGWDVPHELKYGDETFEIKDTVRSMKLFNGAVRWRCKIDGRQIELFNNGDSWWMIA